MQNKPKVKYAKMNVNSLITSEYEKLDTWLMGKTKPKQTQLKPKQSQFKPISKPNKPNSNPIKANKIALKIYPFGINCPIVYMIFGIRL